MRGIHKWKIIIDKIMYFDDLLEFSIEEIKYGARCHRQDPNHGTFFPKPADIIRHLQTGKSSTEEKAELAWAQVIQCLRANGSYGGLNIEDKQGIAALKSFSTWKDFCMMDASKMTWTKKEFLSMYSTYENTPLEMLPSSLPGLVELHNHKKDNANKGAIGMGAILEGIKNKRLKDKAK